MSQQPVVEVIRSTDSVEVKHDAIEIAGDPDTELIETRSGVEVVERHHVDVVETGGFGPRGLPGESATEYEVDSDIAADEQGPLAMGYRNDEGADITTADDRHTPFSGDSTGAMFTRARLLEALLRDQVGPYSTPLVGSLSSTGIVTLMEPDSGQRLRVRRVWIKGAWDLPDGVGVEFELKLGDTVIARDDVITSQPYVDGVVKLGDVDAALTIELFTAQKLFYNIAVDTLD